MKIYVVVVLQLLILILVADVNKVKQLLCSLPVYISDNPKAVRV